ncbi:hypothetical protein ACWC4D_40460 [Streptomyces sp. NPDC001288]|uniref:hypothetical protein n=1 Tax=Streptomyces sp. NPDC001297 TaxID=3364559 RepID=UPI003678DC42
MSYILLGHGSIDLEPGFVASGMETVAIPQGTTLQVYSDAGQTLLYGADELDRWERLQAPWGPLDSSNVTYNLVLQNDEGSWEHDLANDPRFGGNTLVRPGREGVPDPIRLCHGTPDTCPTRPEQVAGGMTHTCDGILGTLQGDLYWLACTGFVGLEGANLESVNAVIGGHTRSVTMGEDPDWVPTEADQRVIATNNFTNINNRNLSSVGYARNNDSHPFWLGGFAFVIGPFKFHDRRHYDYARYQREDSFEGTVTVHTERGKIKRLSVSGAPLHKQDIVRASVSLIDDIEVVFR